MSECVCGRPLSGAAICEGCAYSLQVALGDISSHWRDLDTVKARQTRYGASGGRGGEMPLPVDARFLGWNADGSRLQDAVKNTMATWARIVLDERPVLTGPTHPACLHLSCSALNRSRPPRDDVASVCGYLLGHADWIKTQHWATEILDEMQDAAEQLRRMVDRPKPRIFAGPCRDCGADMYGRPGVLEVECKPCGLSYNVTEMLEWMRAQVYGRLVTAKEGVVLLSRFGLPIQQKTIDKWWERKRITDHGHDPAGKRLYLFDDLVTLAAANAPAERAS